MAAPPGREATEPIQARTPELSVVMTVVDGGGTLVRCLDALAAQVDPPALEVIVPWDDTVPEVARLAERYPRFRFLELGRLPTEHPAPSFAGQHELFDRRRAAGLAVATAPLLAILEDRGVPRPDWARTMVSLHREHRAAAIGGPIENGVSAPLNWAVYYCDFGRYQLPFAPGPRPYVSDVNICYRREALERVAELWAGRYHETTVNWALRRAGEELLLRPEPVVDQHRSGLRLGRLLRERASWGRLFGYTRAREISLAKRVLLTAAAPVTVLLLYVRLMAGRLDRSRLPASFVAASPAILLLLSAWCLGEALGYLTRKA